MASQLFLMEPTQLRISRGFSDVAQDVYCNNAKMVRSAGDGMELQQSLVADTPVHINSQTNMGFMHLDALSKSGERDIFEDNNALLSRKATKESPSSMKPSSMKPSSMTPKPMQCEVNEFSFEKNFSEGLNILRLELKKLKEVNEKLTEEKLRLSSQLGLQSQVNKELKTLLIASIGEDLEDKFEQITMKRLITNEEVRKLLIKLEEKTEKTENLLIQCDIWRSKFLASKVLVDQLAHWKCSMEPKYRECLSALEQLLDERVQLAKTISSSNRFLKQLTNLNDDDHLEVDSSNCSTFDLAITNLHLSKNISRKVFNNSLLCNIMDNTKDMETLVNDYFNLSMAEEKAREVLEERKKEHPSKLEIDIAPHNIIGQLAPVRASIWFFPCRSCRGQIQNL